MIKIFLSSTGFTTLLTFSTKSTCFIIDLELAIRASNPALLKFVRAATIVSSCNFSHIIRATIDTSASISVQDLTYFTFAADNTNIIIFPSFTEMLKALLVLVIKSMTHIAVVTPSSVVVTTQTIVDFLNTEITSVIITIVEMLGVTL